MQNKALLYALRKAYQPEARDLIARCLGSIGAIDPGKTMSLSFADNIFNNQNVYIDNRVEVYICVFMNIF